MAAPRHSNVQKLLQKIEESQIGYNSTLQGPFGTKRGRREIDSIQFYMHSHDHVYMHTVVYTDYTASGK